MPMKKKVVSNVKKKVVRKKITRKKTKTGGRGMGDNNDPKKFSLLEYARKNGGQSPVEYLLDIINAKDDEGKPKHEESLRRDAAKAAAPYCHPKLRSTEIKGEIIPATFIIEDA
jgi:hypothetical protein